MSSDVRRTTIEDAVTEAALEVRRNFSPMAADEILIALNSEHMSKARAALYAAVDRTRPPEAARSPSYDDLLRFATRLSTRDCGCRPICRCDEQATLHDERLEIMRDARTLLAASPSPDPRGRSNDEPIFRAEKCDDGTDDWSCTLRYGNVLLLIDLDKDDAGVAINRGGTFVAQPPAAPATTGARAEAVNPQEIASSIVRGFAHLGQEVVATDVLNIVENCLPDLYTAPPEVTHGAAIGGDVVTVRDQIREFAYAMETNASRKSKGPERDDLRRWHRALTAEIARATASTRSDGGDVGRDAK